MAGVCGLGGLDDDLEWLEFLEPLPLSVEMEELPGASGLANKTRRGSPRGGLRSFRPAQARTARRVCASVARENASATSGPPVYERDKAPAALSTHAEPSTHVEDVSQRRRGGETFQKGMPAKARWLTVGGGVSRHAARGDRAEAHLRATHALPPSV